MITAPAVPVLRHSSNPAWESRSSSGEKGALSPASRTYAQRSAAADDNNNNNAAAVSSPADPHRQAGRLPIKLLKMLTARAGHIMHPEYLQPLPSTPISPIEVSLFSWGARKKPAFGLFESFEVNGVKPEARAADPDRHVISCGQMTAKSLFRFLI